MKRLEKYLNEELEFIYKGELYELVECNTCDYDTTFIMKKYYVATLKDDSRRRLNKNELLKYYSSAYEELLNEINADGITPEYQVVAWHCGEKDSIQEEIRYMNFWKERKKKKGI